MERRKFIQKESFVTPEPLKQGDVIGVISPSSQVDLPIEIKTQAYSYLKDKGFKVKEADGINLNYGHTAGKPQERANQIHEFVKNPEIRAVMSFWGGYNSNQLLDYLDFGLIKDNPKMFVGYSDFTVVNLAISSLSGLVTYTGPSIISFTKPKQFDYTWTSFDEVCINRKMEIQYVPSESYTDDLDYIENSVKPRELKHNSGLNVFRNGKSVGVSMSANLISLASLSGSRFFPNLENKILFLEEAEYANTSMVDRALTQLKQVGAFSNLKGVVLGRFMSQTGFNDSDRLTDLIADTFGNFSYPVMYDIDFGHTDPMITVPNGITCELDCTNKGFKFKHDN